MDRIIRTGEIQEAQFKKYQKKPVVVEAYQTAEEVEIETLEGTMKANRGDYIIRGVKGELYPCKPDVFQDTYTNNTDTSIEDDVMDNLREMRELIRELSDKQLELNNVKAAYEEQEFNIMYNSEINFKRLYGAANDKTRKHHVQVELADLTEEKESLEISIGYLKRRISYLKCLIKSKLVVMEVENEDW